MVRRACAACCSRSTCTAPRSRCARSAWRSRAGGRPGHPGRRIARAAAAIGESRRRQQRDDHTPALGRGGGIAVFLALHWRCQPQPPPDGTRGATAHGDGGALRVRGAGRGIAHDDPRRAPAGADVARRVGERAGEERHPAGRARGRRAGGGARAGGDARSHRADAQGPRRRCAYRRRHGDARAECPTLRRRPAGARRSLLGGLLCGAGRDGGRRRAGARGRLHQPDARRRIPRASPDGRTPFIRRPARRGRRRSGARGRGTGEPARYGHRGRRSAVPHR